MVSLAFVKELFQSEHTGTYCFIIETEVNGYGDTVGYIRINQPCWGEMRKYRSTHGEDADWNDEKPTDLFHPFPKGEPVYVYNKLPSKIPVDFYELVFDPESSPWRTGLDNPQFIKDCDGDIIGVKNGTKIDPTVYVNLLRVVTRIAVKQNSVIENSSLENYQKILAYLSSSFQYRKFCCGFTLREAIDINLFKDGSPRKLSKRTLEERGDYNRKDNENIFYTKNSVNLSSLLQDAKISSDKEAIKFFGGL